MPWIFLLFLVNCLIIACFVSVIMRAFGDEPKHRLLRLLGVIASLVIYVLLYGSADSCNSMVPLFIVLGAPLLLIVFCYIFGGAKSGNKPENTDDNNDSHTEE